MGIMRNRNLIYLLPVLFFMLLFSTFMHANKAKAEGNLNLRLSVTFWGSNESITVEDINLEWNGDGWIPVEQQPSISDGTVSYTGLYPGEYHFTIEKEGYYPYDDWVVLNQDRTFQVTLAPKTEPQSLEFYDENENLGVISGSFWWSAPEVEDSVEYSYYGIYFEDRNGGRIGDALVTVGKNVYDPGSRTFNEEVANINIPVNANKMRLYKQNGTPVNPSDIRATPAFAYIWDLPDAPKNAYMVDNDPAHGIVDGTIYWDGIEDETDVSEYIILKPYEGPIGSVPKGSGSYSFHIQDELYNFVDPYQITAVKGNQLSGISTQVVIIDNMEDQIGLSADIDDDNNSFEFGIPVPGAFTDTDSDAGQIGGVLSWTYPEYYENNFEVYFLNDADEAVSGIVSAYFGDGPTNEETEYSYTLRIPDNTVIPAGATKLGVYMRYYPESAHIMSHPGIIALTDSIKSSNANLTSLSTNPAVILSPSFSASETSYTASVSSSVSSINITAATEHPHATFTVMGMLGYSGVSLNVSLSYGDNYIPIVVTAENGTTKVYYLKVTRSQAIPGRTQLNHLTVAGYSLNPSFSRDITDYTVNVPISETEITVTAAVYDSTSTASIGTLAGASVTNTVYLNPLITEVPVKVTAQDSTQGTYKITVIKPFLLTLNDGLGAAIANKIEGIPSGTTAGTLLSSIVLPNGLTKKVTDANGAAVNDSAVLVSGMKLVLEQVNGNQVTITYEITTLNDMIHQLAGTTPGSKLQVNQLLKLITSSNKPDLTGDGKFDAADVRKILLEISPVK